MRKRIELQRKQRGKVITPANTSPWPHEQRVAKILASAGYTVEFMPKTNSKSADILLNGIEYEVKSPKTVKANSLEHLIKKALKQSSNIIIDTSRMKNVRDVNIERFLVSQKQSRKVIKNMLMITKQGQIIDISMQV